MFQHTAINLAVLFTIACSAANATGHRGGNGAQLTADRKTPFLQCSLAVA